MERSLDQMIVPPAAGKQSSKADFDRNRDGLYGGLPKARDPIAPGPRTNAPHPERDTPTECRARKPENK
jgi:hypothetical protein